MKRLTQKIAAGATALASLAFASTSVASAATADTSVKTSQHAGMHWDNHGMGKGFPGPGLMFDKNIQRTVVNISNGVQTTITSTDAATVTKLQSMKEPPAPPADAKFTVSRTNISNGIQITMTSTDAATVTKLQDMGKHGPGFGPGFGGPRGGHGGPAMMGMFDKNVQRTVTNISNGVTTTLTSTDAATVTKLQSFKQPAPPTSANITVTQANISNGVEISMTSTDPATVTKLQNREKHGPGFGPHGRHGGHKPATLQ